jgi:hypothetical protein
LLTGHPGTWLANGEGVWIQICPRLINSAGLVFISGVIGRLLGVALGSAAALRKNGWFDRVTKPPADGAWANERPGTAGKPVYLVVRALRLRSPSI